MSLRVSAIDTNSVLSIFHSFSLRSEKGSLLLDALPLVVLYLFLLQIVLKPVAGANGLVMFLRTSQVICVAPE